MYVNVIYYPKKYNRFRLIETFNLLTPGAQNNNEPFLGDILYILKEIRIIYLTNVLTNVFTVSVVSNNNASNII